MDYPGHYKTQIINAIQSIDLDRIAQVIEIFKDAREHGRRIFVCGNSGLDAMAAQVLCELVKGASINRTSHFRILALSDQLLRVVGHNQEAFNDERVFVEQLKNFAEPEDVVMGICPSGNSASVVNAIEYGNWIGCRTIAITGNDGGRLAQMAELNVRVPITHEGSIEDAHVIICHIIGYYFVDFERNC